MGAGDAGDADVARRHAVGMRLEIARQGLANRLLGFRTRVGSRIHRQARHVGAHGAARLGFDHNRTVGGHDIFFRNCCTAGCCKWNSRGDGAPLQEFSSATCCTRSCSTTTTSGPLRHWRFRCLPVSSRSVSCSQWSSGGRANLWIVGVMHAFGNAYIVTTFGRIH